MKLKHLKRHRFYIVMSICVILVIAVWIGAVLWSTSEIISDDDTNGHVMETITPILEPRISLVAPDMHSFGGALYDLHFFEREGNYSISRVLTQTYHGYIIAIVLPHGWPAFEPPHQPSHLARVSSGFETIEPLFRESVAWEFFHFAVADRNGYVYVLGENLHGNLALYIYNYRGHEIARYDWRREFTLGPSWARTYIVDDIIVTVQGDFVSMFSICGEIVFGGLHTFLVDTMAEFSVYGDFIANMVSATIGGGFLYAQIHCNVNGQILVKKEVASGQILWEEPLPRHMDVPFALAFDEYNSLLYLLQAQGMYVFDEGTWAIRQAKYLLDTDYYHFLFLHDFFNVFIHSLMVTEEGIIHIVLNRNCCSAHIYEWTIKRLDGEVAEIRQEEIRQELLYRDFIHIADVSRHATHDYLRVMAREQDILVSVDILGSGTSVSYVEQLVAALYAGHADWDVIHMPLRLLDAPRLATLGLLVDILDVLGSERFSDENAYFTNVIASAKIDGELYFVPWMFSVPVLWVSRDYPSIDDLRILSQDWHWEDFLAIVRDMYASTGIPPISAPDVLDTWNIPISNMLPFYLFNEEVLLDISNNRDALRQVLYLYGALANSSYSMDSGQMGMFTFSGGMMQGFWRMQERGWDFSETHVLLPIPSMHGERPFSLDSAYGFLSAGQHVLSAINIIVDYFDIIGTDDPRGTAARALSSVARPSHEAIQHVMISSGFLYAPMQLFEKDAEIRGQANTQLSLPWTVVNAIMDAVESFVHGVVSLDHTVRRIEDIMWMFLDE